MTQPVSMSAAPVPEDTGPGETVAERRQRAREAGYDASLDNSLNVDPVGAVEAAIEVATRVRLDGFIISAAAHEAGVPPGVVAASLPAALRLLGLEVEE